MEGWKEEGKEDGWDEEGVRKDEVRREEEGGRREGWKEEVRRNELQVPTTKIQRGKMALQMWRGAEHNQRHFVLSNKPIKTPLNNLFTLTNVQHLACTSQSEPEQSARQPVSVPEIGLLGLLGLLAGACVL